MTEPERFVPEAWAASVIENLRADPYAFARVALGPPPRLTLAQRVRYALAMRRWALHDRLFPDCRESDE